MGATDDDMPEPDDDFVDVEPLVWSSAEVAAALRMTEVAFLKLVGLGGFPLGYRMCDSGPWWPVAVVEQWVRDQHEHVLRRQGEAGADAARN